MVGPEGHTKALKCFRFPNCGFWFCSRVFPQRPVVSRNPFSRNVSLTSEFVDGTTGIHDLIPNAWPDAKRTNRFVSGV